MLFFKLDYVIEKSRRNMRETAPPEAHAAPARRRAVADSKALVSKFVDAAKELALVFLTHQSWKGHDGVFSSVPWAIEQPGDNHFSDEGQTRRRALRKLAGVRLSVEATNAIWPRLLEHKWYLGERLGRDVGLRVAVVDYFENIQAPRRPSLNRGAWEPLPRLPMMVPFGERA